VRRSKRPGKSLMAAVTASPVHRDSDQRSACAQRCVFNLVAGVDTNKEMPAED